MSKLSPNFSHRLYGDDDFSRSTLIDVVENTADSAEAVLSMLQMQYAEEGASTPSRGHVFSILESVRHQINDIRAIVDSYCRQMEECNFVEVEFSDNERNALLSIAAELNMSPSRLAAQWLHDSLKAIERIPGQ